jgi:nucleotide-binding universal stress UspA family protein
LAFHVPDYLQEANPMTIKHILFPVDFSERSASAVPFVRAMAERHDAKITLLAVVHPYYAGGLAGAPVIDAEELRHGSKQELDRTFVTEFAGMKVERVAETGDPGAVIARWALENSVDLIMMPTHGYGPFRQLLLGSVTAKVLHDAHCPVWTDAHTGEAPDLEHLRMGNILCAVDTTEDSARVLRYAATMSKALGTKMRIIHAVPGLEAWPERQMDQEFEEQIRENARTAIERLEKAADIDFPVCVNTGAVPDVIREEANQHNADILVIGRGSIQGTLGRLRTHAHAIIRNSPCPVISV